MPENAPTPPPPRPSKALDAGLAMAALAWFIGARELAARSASGISQHVDLIASGFVLKPLFLLFLLIVGFSLLDLIGHRRSSYRDLLALPARPSASQEWRLGAAIGWSAVVLSVIPVVIFGSLQVQLWTEPRAFLYALLTLIGAALSALTLEITFRGYAFRRLISSIGPLSSTLVLSFLYGILFALQPGSNGRSFVVMGLLGLLLSLGWLRTHALWLSWGLNFAWTTSLGALFGLPVAGSTELSSIIQTTAVGKRVVTGGPFGPEASIFTIFALLLAMIPLVWLTRDYAWNYTHAPIVPGGFPMEVPPPPAHASVSSAPAPPPPLVQILPTTSQGAQAPRKSPDSIELPR